MLAKPRITLRIICVIVLQGKGRRSDKVRGRGSGDVIRKDYCGEWRTWIYYIGTPLIGCLYLMQVGEERMLYLLSYASIFVPLPNFCLLQVAGRPFSRAAPKSKQLIATGRRSQCELPTEVQSDTPRIEQISTRKVKVPICMSVLYPSLRQLLRNVFSWDSVPRNFGDSLWLMMKLQNVEQCDEVTEGVTRSRKRTRPSSWVRRKQRAVQGAPNFSSFSTVVQVFKSS